MDLDDPDYSTPNLVLTKRDIDDSSQLLSPDTKRGRFETICFNPDDDVNAICLKNQEHNNTNAALLRLHRDTLVYILFLSISEKQDYNSVSTICKKLHALIPILEKAKAPDYIRLIDKSFHAPNPSGSIQLPEHYEELPDIVQTEEICGSVVESSRQESFGRYFNLWQDARETTTDPAALKSFHEEQGSLLKVWLSQVYAGAINNDYLKLMFDIECLSRYPEAGLEEDFLWDEARFETTGAIKLLPKTIGGLRAFDPLEILIIYSSDIKHISKELFQLIQLEHLRISFNEFIKSIPNEIGQLTKLKYLYLRGNELTSVPSEISKLTNLESLHLENNRIESLPSSIVELTKLRSLDLKSNRLRVIQPEILKLTSLNRLNLASNDLDSIPNGLEALTQLEKLTLSENNLTNLSQQLSNLTNLKRLFIHDNKLTYFPLEVISLTKLIHLSIEKNNLTVLPEIASALTSLRIMTFDYQEGVIPPITFDEKNILHRNPYLNCWEFCGIYKKNGRHPQIGDFFI